MFDSLFTYLGPIGSALVLVALLLPSVAVVAGDTARRATRSAAHPGPPARNRAGGAPFVERLRAAFAAATHALVPRAP